MRFNYFHQNQAAALFTGMGRFVTGQLSRWLPQLTGRLGQQFLIQPNGKRQYDFGSHQPTQQWDLTTRLGNARAHLFGNGERTVVLSHGWADNSTCFHALINQLIEQGYRVAALDHVGHGKSEGKRAHLLAFIEAMTALMNQLEADGQQVEAIIGHSMGAFATLNLPEALLRQRKVVLISAPINFFDQMFHTLERVGISRRVMVRVLESIASQYQVDWQSLLGERQIPKLHGQVHLIHDRSDRFAPFADIQAFAEKAGLALTATEGLGHRRILSDTEVIAKINRIVAA
ncbi:alpha/beta hydrolase [Ferrimonas marina]|uniref:Serine aminopeptidase, S33 n=1 Tax=Ferrimonas marina TaxID=299255 RepID=A0A1M5MKT9_9GAMM|nr:alpha/beta hydrolase [Ferrimonas marina]SHG77855.1 Serine aminopeptidase, S33 [Ferrimonas marina]